MQFSRPPLTTAFCSCTPRPHRISCSLALPARRPTASWHHTRRPWTSTSSNSPPLPIPNIDVRPAPPAARLPVPVPRRRVSRISAPACGVLHRCRTSVVAHRRGGPRLQAARVGEGTRATAIDRRSRREGHRRQAMIQNQPLGRCCLRTWLSRGAGYGVLGCRTERWSRCTAHGWKWTRRGRGKRGRAWPAGLGVAWSWDTCGRLTSEMRG